MTELICGICGKPVLPGEPRYTIKETHYDCEFPHGRKTFSEVIDDGDAKMTELLRNLGIKPKRPKRREGEGAVAQRAIRRAAALVENELGEQISITLFWNQQGAYRGPKWDLARWGFWFEFAQENGKSMKAHCVCWTKMTDFVRQKTVRITREGPLEFDVG